MNSWKYVFIDSRVDPDNDMMEHIGGFSPIKEKGAMTRK